jgi:hypothetical protein
MKNLILENKSFYKVKYQHKLAKFKINKNKKLNYNKFNRKINKALINK